MLEDDAGAARRVFSLAFGTFLGVGDPASYRADCDYVSTRFGADPEAAFVAELDGEVVGSNFATRWGSVGFFGPLTVRPDLWGGGIAQRLMDPVMSRFETWGTRHAGLYTFPHSIKHVHLYRKYGFWPGHLTAIMSLQVKDQADPGSWQAFSAQPAAVREELLDSLAGLTDAIYPGLGLDREIHAVREQGLGETVVIEGQGGPTAFAVCHCGAGTEAGAGNCYVKFAAARPGAGAVQRFAALLDACEGLAAGRGLGRLLAGVSLARREAAETLLERGFRVDIQGLAMHRPAEAAYHRPGVWVLDDWR